MQVGLSVVDITLSLRISADDHAPQVSPSSTYLPSRSSPKAFIGAPRHERCTHRRGVGASLPLQSSAESVLSPLKWGWDRSLHRTLSRSYREYRTSRSNHSHRALLRHATGFPQESAPSAKQIFPASSRDSRRLICRITFSIIFSGHHSWGTVLALGTSELRRGDS